MYILSRKREIKLYLVASGQIMVSAKKLGNAPINNGPQIGNGKFSRRIDQSYDEIRHFESKIYARSQNL